MYQRRISNFSAFAPRGAAACKLSKESPCSHRTVGVFPRSRTSGSPLFGFPGLPIAVFAALVANRAGSLACGLAGSLALAAAALLHTVL